MSSFWLARNKFLLAENLGSVGIMTKITKTELGQGQARGPGYSNQTILHYEINLMCYRATGLRQTKGHLLGHPPALLSEPSL